METAKGSSLSSARGAELPPPRVRVYSLGNEAANNNMRFTGRHLVWMPKTENDNLYGYGVES